MKSCESRVRPFPWPCGNCGTRTVVPAVIDHTAKVKHDGLIYELHLPNVEVPRCQTCGATYPTDAIDDKVSDALRERRRLLTPDQIKEGIKAVDLNQQEVAERLGVAPETISRWVNGVLIQSRAMDNLLRVYFAFPQVQRALQGANQDRDLGLRNGVSVTG
jgi:putative zinc finger/helix-turn-helix YgiT family protein